MIRKPDEDSGRRATADVEAVVGRWCAAARPVRPLGAGGFSGCPVWLVEAGGRPFVLKGFPPTVGRQRASEVHRKMIQARAAGVREVPAVQRSIRGDSLEQAAGRLWELIDFVEGEPVSRPLPAQAKAALVAMGRLHAAVAQPDDTGPSPAMASRTAAAQRMLARPWPALLAASRGAVRGSLPWETRQRLETVCGFAARIERLLPRLACRSPACVRRQWVLRDIWSDHVLFGAPDRRHVAGIIDYHAAGIDTPATDLARLLGSWLERESVDPDWWAARLDAYEAVASLPPPERRLVPFLAASGVLFGLDHWFGWTLEEGREFGSSSQVVGRIDRLLESLPVALEMLEVWTLDRV